MRLSLNGPRRTLAHRLFIRLTGLLGAEIDDVGKVSMHYPEFFGVPFLNLAQALLRGRSEWTVGERELFASVVSKANEFRRMGYRLPGMLLH